MWANKMYRSVAPDLWKASALIETKSVPEKKQNPFKRSASF